MSLLAHTPRLAASESSFGAKVGLMRSTIGQAEPAPAGASTQERSRRRRRTVMGGNADEYMDIVSDLDAPPVGAPAASAASNRGAGSLGFSGTVSAADGVRPEGVIALADGFGAGPTEPRLPQTRGSDRSEESPGFGGPEDAGQAEGGSNEVATARESW